jgi:RNA polymerase sigma factor (sigma-70 family)
VSGLCGALLRSRPEAEDATQQTFLSAHRALLNGSEPQEPAAWLATIARNACWSRIRMRMRQPLSGEPADAVSPEPDPLAEAIRRADLSALWQAIEALPRQQRDALLLREFGGLSYGELAAALSVSAPAVESLLFRARQRLRAQLRAVYASVAGASWLEPLARAFAGGSAPVAAKVAALGVGAAAVTGGAVVAPDVLERSHHRAPPAVEPVRHVPAAPAPASPGQAAVAPAVATPTTAGHRGGGDRGDAASRDETRVTESVRGTSAERNGPGGDRGGDGSRSSGSGGPRTSDSGTSDSGTSDSGTGGSGSGGSGSGGSGSDGSGSGGSRDGGGDGVTATTPTATLPPTVPTETSDGHGGGGGGD